MSEASDSSAGVPSRRPRRPRYSGTHPRRFEQRYKELEPAAFPEMQKHVRAQGRTPAGTHIPVLLAEVLKALKPQPRNIVADCTLGYGGHALEFIKKIGPGGRLIALDVDTAELRRCETRLKAASGWDHSSGAAAAPPVQLSFHHSHFAGLGKILARETVAGCDVVLADLGVSSMQIDDPARGFSYKHDGPLDMRMDTRLPRTAADCLARLSLEELAAALTSFADEPQAERIARMIAVRRAMTPFTRTGQLVDLVFEAKGISRRSWRERPPERMGELHPAARTFQALRMLVNDELAGLAQFLRNLPYCLRGGGRAGIISFHSGEDRLVEDSFRRGFDEGLYEATCQNPICPTAEEVAANPRSRSAVFRWAVRAPAEAVAG